MAKWPAKLAFEKDFCNRLNSPRKDGHEDRQRYVGLGLGADHPDRGKDLPRFVPLGMIES
jgi:hypothetical protein